ncbi:MAG: radical SAM protein [Candidatus Omnitrophota bacterium]|nr:radical SAM protein [Candidatus Omnitrophota bacterium]
MKYIYGPVKSRRLGNSLGISLTPYKVCSFDCVYCQLGKTTIKTSEIKEYVNLEEILQELKAFISNTDFKNTPVNYITLSGSGEPTLFLSIGKLISYIKKLVNIPIAVLTNSSLLHNIDVRRNLLSADLIVTTLNASSQTVFEKIHQTEEEIKLEEIINGLIALRREFKGKIYLEVMLIKGINDSVKEMERLKEIVNRIGPDKIQLVAPSRPPSQNWVKPPDLKTMKKIQEIFGERCEVF